MLTTPTGIRKRIILALLVVVLAFVAIWLFNHSRLSISVQGETSGGITYSIRDTESGETKEIKSDSHTVTAIIKRGSYEIHVKNSSGSYLAFVSNTPRFLGAYSVDARLVDESSRKFVGDSPKACLGYTGSLLISGNCGGMFGELLVHQPATSDLTTHTTSGPSKLYGVNTTLLPIGKQLFVITKTLKSGADVDSPSKNVNAYSLLSFNAAFGISKQIELSGLDGAQDYFFEASHGNEFIAYSPSSKKAYKYSSKGDFLGSVNLDSAQVKGLSLTALSFIDEQSYVLLYNSTNGGPGVKPTSELVVKMGAATKHYVYKNKSYTDVSPCGTGKLCLLGGDAGADVFAISGSKSRHVFSVRDALKISTDSLGHLIAVTKQGVLNIDVDNMKGYTEYSLAGYHFNGFYKYSDNIILSLTGADNRTVALLVDPSQPNHDSIDKKILDLEKLAGVSFASIYGKYIYVSANLGNLVYNQQLSSYTYDPTNTQAAASAINTEIDRLGIDRSTYVITSNAF